MDNAKMSVFKFVIPRFTYHTLQYYIPAYLNFFGLWRFDKTQAMDSSF
jgi:hypothetical protein